MRTNAVDPGTSTRLHPLHNVRFTAGSLETSMLNKSLHEAQNTHIRVLVFCPIAFIDFTYVRAKSTFAVE